MLPAGETHHNRSGSRPIARMTYRKTRDILGLPAIRPARGESGASLRSTPATLMPDPE